MAQLRPVDLEGSVALVTGGTGQVGAAVADLLGSAGAEVAVADEPGPELQRMEIRLGLAAFECGFSDPTELVTVFGAVEERFGRLDLLVCSHGSPPPSRPLLEIPFEEYRRTLAVNLDSTFLAVQQAGRAMIAGGRGGRIVIVGSTDGAAGGADFEASQAALPGLIRGASEGLAEHDVTVNAILHGPLRPEPADDEYVDPAERPRDAGGPLGEAADVARAALWLIDPDNSYVTGSVVTVDGGRSS